MGIIMSSVDLNSFTLFNSLTHTYLFIRERLSVQVHSYYGPFIV
jgi:hypothetical protein